MDKGNPRELWEYVLTQVELSISSANFNTWFRNSFIVKVGDDGVISIGVPSQFFKDWYMKKFHTLLIGASCQSKDRLILGDTIKFTSLLPFRFKITGRTKSYINTFGEEIIGNG